MHLVIDECLCVHVHVHVLLLLKYCEAIIVHVMYVREKIMPIHQNGPPPPPGQINFMQYRFMRLVLDSHNLHKKKQLKCWFTV